MNKASLASPAVSLKTGNIGAGGDGSQLKIEIGSVDHADSAQFRTMLERHMNHQTGSNNHAAETNSLGSVIAKKATGLATQVKQDQQYVSKLLETATRSGDSLHLMRAMMALNDYQLRVQTISKTVSKAATSIDALTKLQ